MTVVSMRPVLRLLARCGDPARHRSAPRVRVTRAAGDVVDVGRRPPGFTEVYPYTDGIEVQVSDVWTGRRLGVPVAELTVTIRNGTAHTFEAWIKGDFGTGLTGCRRCGM